MYMYIPSPHPIRLYMCNIAPPQSVRMAFTCYYDIIPNNKFKSVTLVMNSSQLIPIDFQKFLADFT